MASEDLTDLETVKKYLKIKEPDTSSDEVLAILITAVSDYVQGQLNRIFSVASYVQRSNGNGRDFMLFAEIPIVSVESVTVDGREIPEAIDERASGYVVDANGVYLRGSVFTRGVKNVVLTYSAGFETIPPAVADCATLLAAKKFKYLDRIGHVSKILAGETVTFEKSDVTDELRSVLRNYMKVVAP